MEKRMAELFAKYLSNTCTEAELNEFFGLIRKSTDDEPLRNLIRETYQAIRNASDTYVDHTGELVSPEVPPDPQPFPGPIRRHRRIRQVLLAGTLITGLSFAITHFTAIPVKPSSARARPVLKKRVTEKAEYRYFLLPDSTQVWLNAGSSLEYPEEFGKAVREVTLSGEAYFDVKHAAEHPFIIHTGQILTTVLGTAFNINAYPEKSNITVTVIRGKVKVSRNNKLVATLVRGQQAKVSAMDSTVVQKNIPANTLTGWQQDNLVYDDETLEDVIADLQRVYSTNIQISNVNIRRLKISTRFRRELGISQALEILCTLTDTRLFQKDGTYLIQ